MNRRSITLVSAAVVLTVCAAPGGAPLAQQRIPMSVVAQFDEPWAMTFLPDGRLLVTEKRGALKLYEIGGATGDVSGVPDVAYGGEGGLGDVVLHPDFSENRLVYLSYVEEGTRGRRAIVVRAELVLDDAGGGRLENVERIWRQRPNATGRGQFGQRIVFGPDGHLWIGSGDREQPDRAQDMGANLGKIVRLNDDGTLPDDNPFADRRGVTREIWSLGHCNPLGLAFDSQGRLWEAEMGPQGGDELNLIERGANYGYPLVSNGRDYSGRPSPDHDAQSDLAAPKVSWTQSISPASLMFYSGSQFPAWQGSAFIAGLASQTLVRVEIDGESAREAERFTLSNRIREVEQGPDGAIWLLEDAQGGGGRLLRLSAE